MIDQIQEIAALIAVKIFGKSYMQLRYESGMERGTTDSLKKSELFEACQLASEIRMEVFSQIRRLGRDPTQVPMDELLALCEMVIARPEVIERQKAELRRRGFMVGGNREESTVEANQ